MTSRIRIIELGAKACSIVFVMEANNLKNMLIDSIIVNATNRKKKKAPGSRRRLAITGHSQGNSGWVVISSLTIQR
jgi:hypothetical protein